MTLNELTWAAAARLRALWPDRPVYVDDIPREADGCLYIGLIDSEQGQELDRRFKRSVSFQILYFRADQDALAYQDWAEALYDGFRTLEAGGRTVRLKNCGARENGEQRCYQFTFDADLLFWEAVSGETMQTLAQTINDKEG